MKTKILFGVLLLLSIAFLVTPASATDREILFAWDEPTWGGGQTLLEWPVDLPGGVILAETHGQGWHESVPCTDCELMGFSQDMTGMVVRTTTSTAFRLTYGGQFIGNTIIIYR